MERDGSRVPVVKSGTSSFPAGMLSAGEAAYKHRIVISGDMGNLHCG